MNIFTASGDKTIAHAPVVIQIFFMVSLNCPYKLTLKNIKLKNTNTNPIVCVKRIKKLNIQYRIMFFLTGNSMALNVYNKASAEKMVADCKDEGIELSMEEANAIVAARANKRFTSVDDLEGVLTGRKIAELDPIEEDDDLIFNPNAMPGMKAY